MVVGGMVEEVGTVVVVVVVVVVGQDTAVPGILPGWSSKTANRGA